MTGNLIDRQNFGHQLIHLLRRYLVALILWLDDRRIRIRLRRTEQYLRLQDTSGLSGPLQIARSRHLDHLHHYWRKSIFPRHSDRPGRWSPCFIDRAGRTCAVAELLVADGQGELAQQVAGQANYAYLAQMVFPELDAWAASSGLSKAELALIQPQYVCPEECVTAAYQMVASWNSYLQWIMRSGTALTLGSFVLGSIGRYRRRWPIVWLGAILGLVTGFGLLYANLTAYKDTLDVALGFGFHCPGAGVGDICQPRLNREPVDQLLGQIAVGWLLSSLFLLISVVGVVNAAKREQFGWSHLVLSVAGAFLLVCVISVTL